jgi:hypothetical protein
MKTTITALTTLFALTFVAAAATRAADKPAAVDPKTATLAAAIEDWIGALEADDQAGASARWASGEEATKSLKTFWAGLRKANEKFGYRKWIERGANQIGDAKVFGVGGHSYDHLHIDWAKTDDGWRIARVWMCR